MTNLPNPDLNIKSTGGRELHQASDPVPPPIRYPDSLSDDASPEGILRGSKDPEGTLGGATTQERPLGVQPAKQGGVAIGSRENENLPMGKANVADKLIGKTEKVVGKMSKNPEMHEKGELREAGGKAAVTGQARAPHD